MKKPSQQQFVVCLCCAGHFLSKKEQKAVQGRITDQKTRIKQLVRKYNCIRTQGSSSRPADITDEQISAGDFPWAFRDIPEGAAGEMGRALASSAQLLLVST